jgi:hypothetical protein
MNDDELRRSLHSAELHGMTRQEVVAEVEDATRPKRGWGHRVAWLISLVVVGGLTGGLIVAAMKFVNDPVVARGKVLSAVQASVSPAPGTAGTSRLAGLYIELLYPSLFNQLAQVKSDPQVLEEYTLSSKTNFKHVIAVDVRPLVTGNLDDDAGYKVRQIHAADYRESSDRAGSEKIAIMSKTDGHEQTLFWPHKGKLLTIAITSTDPHDDIAAIMGVIKNSLRWKQ